jgi:hypothetical protein
MMKKDDPYIISNMSVIRKQLALAGYRLSNLLVSIYNSYQSHKSLTDME